MKKIIKYLAGIELIGYMYLFMHIFTYSIILYLNGIDNIKIGVMLEILVASMIISVSSVLIFDNEKINDIKKIALNYVMVLVIDMLFINQFGWLQVLNIKIYEYIGIYTLIYFLTLVTYHLYLRIVDESYTEYLKIYKEGKRG